MKKILKLTLLLATLSNLLVAQTIFDLSAQHFSNSIDGDGEGARYNLPKVYVSTALKYVNGTYVITTSAGQSMDVEIKNPPSTWAVSFDMSYSLYTQSHPLRFTADNGVTIIAAFQHSAINFNGTLYKLDNFYYREHVTGSIHKNGNQVTLQVNGYFSKTINVSNFSKLKFVNISIIQDNYNDVLNGLSIGSN